MVIQLAVVRICTSHQYWADMKQNYRASMIQLHTYSGLFMGWLLFAIFLTGTLSYFSNEISHWMRGAVSQPGKFNSQLDSAFQYLLKQGTDSHSWRINIADKRGSELSVQWRDSNERHSHSLTAESIEPQESKITRGGRFFVTFHYTLQLRQYGGRYLAGLAAMTMLIALYSGIFTHRRFIKDFFTLRTRTFMHFIKDAHAVSGIVTIPFVIIICTSALVIYINLFTPWFAEEHFDNGYRQMSREVTERLPDISAENRPSTPLSSLGPILEHAREAWSGNVLLKQIRLDKPFLSTGRIVVEGVDVSALTNNTQKLVYSSETGEFIGQPSVEGTSRKVRRVLYGLHEGHFFKLDLRWLSFLQGAIATFLIASGMLIWVRKRAEKKTHNHRLLVIVNKVNLSVFIGFPLACLAYFAANKILSASLLNREEFELAAFNYTLLFSVLAVTFLKSDKSKLLLVLVGTLLSGLVVMFDLTAFLRALEGGDNIYASVGLSMWFILFINLFVSWHLWKRYRGRMQ